MRGVPGQPAGVRLRCRTVPASAPQGRPPHQSGQLPTFATPCLVWRDRHCSLAVLPGCRKQYQDVKAAVQQRRQEATAAALAAGQDSLTAARAGLEAGAELLRELLQKQQQAGEGDGIARQPRQRRHA